MRMKSAMLSLIMAMSAAAAGSLENVYGTSFRGKPKYNPDYKPKQAHREMKEFCINGEKVMAYSRKDATVRLRHKK